jgi:molecular chaperone GrpE
VTSDATPASTGATPATRGRGPRVLVATVVVVGFAWFAATPALAGLGEPVDPRDTTEPEDETTTTSTTTTEADAPGTTEADGPTTTVAERDGAEETRAATVDEDDDGTSIAALGAVGVVAFVLGLIVAAIPLGAALARRKKAPGAPLAPPAPGPAPPAPAPTPAAGSPAIGPAPSRDADQIRHQRVVLVEALIALRDQLPSAALGDEAAQALAAAGIVEVRPQGMAFDPAHHRAVHQVATDDPARHNTVASVERPGYSDGTSTIRQPEVVVAVHGSPS